MAEKKERSPQSDLNKQIEDMLSNKKLRAFVRWFCDGQDKDKFEQVSKNYLNGLSLEKAMELYLEKEDVQQAIIHVTKFQKDLNLVRIYNSMVTKALEGDVNSANWVAKFSESSFFKNKIDELQKLMEGINVEDD